MAADEREVFDGRMGELLMRMERHEADHEQGRQERLALVRMALLLGRLLQLTVHGNGGLV